MLKSLVFPFVVGIAIWFVQDYFRDIPVAVYSISDSIEIPGSQGRAEYAQEVAVENTGRNAIKNVSIKVPAHIASYKLTKHSDLAKEESVSQPNSFELLYPELPSGQQIRLLLRHESSLIGKNWISVSHAGGNAQPKEKSTPPINYLWLWIAFTIGFISQTVGDIRRWKRESFAKWYNDDSIFSDSKPWFASNREWSEMQFEAIQRHLTKYDYQTADRSASYRLLNRKKPKLLSDEHWKELTKVAEELLLAKFSKIVTTYISIESLLDLFAIEKPDGLSNKSWSEFKNSIETLTVDKLLPSKQSAESCIRLLEPGNMILSRLPPDLAKSIRDTSRDRYISHLIDGNRYLEFGDPAGVLRTARLDLLTEKERALVTKVLLGFARLKSMPSSWEISELERLIKGDKPEWMKTDEFQALAEFVSKAKSLAEELNSLSREKIILSGEKSGLAAMQKRVKSQLEFIDKVINDPEFINKVEDYDTTFAPGNLENIKVVARTLQLARNAKQPNGSE